MRPVNAKLIAGADLRARTLAEGTDARVMREMIRKSNVLFSFGTLPRVETFQPTLGSLWRRT